MRSDSRLLDPEPEVFDLLPDQPGWVAFGRTLRSTVPARPGSHPRRSGARRVRRRPRRYADGKARRNYAGSSPVTRASGRKKIVAAQFIHNNRLVDALRAQAFASLNASPGAHALYDSLRTRGIEHDDALRRLANRLVGILHGCLKTHTRYNKTTAWATGKTALNLP